MRLLPILMVAAVLVPQAWGQEDSVNSAANALQTVLTDLKSSVDQLSFDNDQLTNRDSTIRLQIAQLQTQLQQLQDQSGKLNEKVSELQAKNTQKQQMVTAIEQENFDLDNSLQKIQVSVKAQEQAMDAGYREYDQLLLQLKGLSNVQPPKPAAPNPHSEAQIHHQIEKLKLMKMIYDSQQRQAQLHDQIMQLQNSKSALPAASAMAHQQILKEQIKDLEGEISNYTPQSYLAVSNSASQWSDAQLHELEGELKDLENNYNQLKDLSAQMGRKMHDSKMSAEEHVEGAKLQQNIDEITRQGDGLRAQLDDLRSQMVELDKRKTYLEGMVKNLP